jgi:hypothetical protein
MDWQFSAPKYSSLCGFVAEMQAGVEDTGGESTPGGELTESKSDLYEAIT